MPDTSRREILAGLGSLGVAAKLATFTPPIPFHGGSSNPEQNGATQPPHIMHGVDPGDDRAELMRLLGTMPSRPAPRFTLLETVRLPAGTRYKIEFLAEPTDSLLHTPPDLIRAYLFVPEHRDGERLSAVLAIHQDGPQSNIGKSEVAGLAGDKNLFYGLELFERGHVVLCPDRFPHAERRWVTPNDITSIDPDRDEQLLNHRSGQLLLRGRNFIGKDVYDFMVAMDVLGSLDYVDSKRIGAIGHSAGGDSLVYFMFADPRVCAGVSSCGFFDMVRFFDQNAPKRRLAAIAMPGLAELGTSRGYLAGIAPRPMLLTRGMWEWGNSGDEARFSKEHVQETRDLVAHAQKSYDRLGATSNLRAIYFDENGGNHDFPPNVRRNAYDWLDRQLAAKV
jgi:dienelactone hydrolase